MGPIQIFVVVTAIAVAMLSGFFMIKKMMERSREEAQKKNVEQQDAVRTALEIFQPFHWEALHFAILSEDYKRLNDEKRDSGKAELVTAYLKAFDSLQSEVKNLDGKLNSEAINHVLSVSLRDGVNRVVQTLSEACRVAQEQQDLTECFKLVEAAYRDSARIESSLRSLYRKA
jgi:phage tail tape-measure protein